MCVFQSDYISCKFYDGKLHTKTQSQEWETVGSCIADCFDLTVDTAVAEASRYQNTIYITEQLVRIPAHISRDYLAGNNLSFRIQDKASSFSHSVSLYHHIEIPGQTARGIRQHGILDFLYGP